MILRNLYTSCARLKMPSNDKRWMQLALSLGARGLGQVAPNPAVGCVIIKDGRLLGRGWTQPGGRPHAEVEALARAGEAARGATAYVSLEPCAHHGQTPPCAEALIKAGIARVVASVEDCDGRVAGQGFAMLRAAGVEVTTGVLAEEAERDLRQWPQPVDHRLCGATAGARNARALRRGDGGRGHGAGR